jgi:hypothetical protein
LTYPEKHPNRDTCITECVPRHVSDRTLLDILVTSPELAEPKKLDDLLGGEETTNEEWVGRKGAWVAIVDLLHVGG